MDKKNKILYVNGDGFNKFEVRDALKNHYDFYVVNSFDDLFIAIHHIWPEVILLDSKIVGSGEVCLFSEGYYSEIPIVLLINNNHNEKDNVGNFCNTVDCACSPFPENLLLETIENVIKKPLG
jgi:hypothetical protein